MANVISRQSVSFGMDNSGFVAGARSTLAVADNLVSSLTSSFSGLGSSLVTGLGVGTGIAAVSGLFSTIESGISSLGSHIAGGFSIANQMEQNSVALETMLGSADKAKNVMGDLKTFAAQTPFEFPELADSAKLLIGFGISGDNVVNTLRMMGDVASGVGKPLGEVAAVYGKIQAVGKLTGETLMQFSEKGIPLLGTLAQMYGKTSDEITTMVSNGQIGADAVTAAFGKMTGSGGKFSGMMAKQSTTMSGLLSTLSDNVSMTFGNIAAGIIDAFDLKGALGGLINLTGTISDSVNGYIAAWTPTIKAAVAETVAWLGNAWANLAPYASAGLSLVTEAVSVGLGWIQTAWMTTTQWLAQNVGWIADVAADAFVTGYEIVSGTLSALWTVSEAVFSGVSSIVGGFFSLFSSQSEDNSARVGTSSQTVGSWIQWLADMALVGFTSISFGLKNWQTIADLAFTDFAYGLVMTGNQIEYVFTQVIPAYLEWFGQNWTNILTDVFNFTTTTFGNLGSNIVSIMSNLPGLISGSVSFGDLWKPLTEGFKSTLSELPKIAERQAGPLEQALKNQEDALAGSLKTGYADAITGAFADRDAIAKGMKGTPDFIKNLGNPQKPETAKPGEANKPGEVAKPGSNPALKDKAKDSGKDASSSKDNKTVYTGSAESYALQFKAAAMYGSSVATADTQTAEQAAASTSGVAVANQQTPADTMQEFQKTLLAETVLIRTAVQSLDKKTKDLGTEQDIL